MRGGALIVLALSSALGCAPNLLSVASLEQPEKTAKDIGTVLGGSGWECKVTKSAAGMHAVGCTKKGRVLAVAMGGKGDEGIVMFFTVFKQPLCAEPGFQDRVATFNATATLGKADCDKDSLLLHRAFLPTSVGFSRKELPLVVETWHDAIVANAQKRGLLDDKLPPGGGKEPGGTPPGTPGPGKPPDGNQI